MYKYFIKFLTLIKRISCQIWRQPLKPSWMLMRRIKSEPLGKIKSLVSPKFFVRQRTKIGTEYTVDGWKSSLMFPRDLYFGPYFLVFSWMICFYILWKATFAISLRITLYFHAKKHSKRSWVFALGSDLVPVLELVLFKSSCCKSW